MACQLLLLLLLVLTFQQRLCGQSDALAKEIEELEQQHQRDITAAKRPLQRAHLEKLREWHNRLTRRNQEALARRLEGEIQALQTVLEPNKKAFSKPSTVRLNLKDAELTGGTQYLKNSKRLTGFKAKGARAEMLVTGLIPRVIYRLELKYSSEGNRRLRFELAGKEFNPRILSSDGLNTSRSMPVGEFTPVSKDLTFKVSMPAYRSKDAIQVHELRLVPKSP